MSGTIAIRRGEPVDRETIAANNRAMASETEGKTLDGATVSAGVDGLFADPARGFYLLAERAERVIGQLMVTRECDGEYHSWRISGDQLSFMDEDPPTGDVTYSVVAISDEVGAMINPDVLVLVP